MVTSRVVSRSSRFSSVSLKWFVVIWLFDHFTLESIPSVNGVWIITFVSHLHAWVMKFKPSLMFFKLLVLTPNNIINVIWMNFSAFLFDETHHVVKTFMAGYVPVCYEIINLLIEPQNFPLFFICKLKIFYLIVTTCDGLLIFSLYFSMPFLVSHFTKATAFGFLDRRTISIEPSR